MPNEMLSPPPTSPSGFALADAGMRRLLLVAVLLVSGSCHGAAIVPEQSQAALLNNLSLVYIGSFRVPRKDSNGNTFSYGGHAIGFNGKNNTLFMTGHVREQLTAEIGIPDVINSENLADLRTAKFVQPFNDATAGRLGLIDPGDRNGIRIGDHLVHDGKLYLSAYTYYDANGSQKASHFARSLRLDSEEPVTGPVAIGDDVHYTSGYMTAIPIEWQALFGGPALTGNCCRSIIGYQSHGPAVSVFDPTKLLENNNVDATPLVHYPSRNPLGPGESTQNPYFNRVTRIEGVVFPGGTRSVLFIGKHGTGPFCYGTGQECGDPVRSRKGNHAYPYQYQVWAYDANDLLKVKRGKRRPHQVEPYATWRLEAPYERNDAHDTGGTAFDPATNRLYFCNCEETTRIFL